MSEDIGALFNACPLPFMLAFSWLYLYVQTFAIPGSFLLNMVAGILFGEIAGLALVACMAASGASCCYLLSSAAGASVTKLAWLAPRLGKMRAAVAQAKRKGALFWYMLSLRFFPVTPNYIVNITSPWVGVPLWTFWLTMAIGLSPYNYATVAAGATITSIQDDFKPMNLNLFVKLSFVALVALLPALCKSRVQLLAGAGTAPTDHDAGATAVALPQSTSSGTTRRTAAAHNSDPELPSGAAAGSASAPEEGGLPALQHRVSTALRHLLRLLTRADKEQSAD